MSKKSPWQTVTTREVYDNAWINVTEAQVINPSGTLGIYGKVHFKNRAIGIVPIDEAGNTWLVGQYRYTLDEYSWEIPEGGGPAGEDILESAKRELKEETGLTADSWTLLMKLHTTNSVSDEEGYVFMAEGLTEGETCFEETEDIEIMKLPLSSAIQMVFDGKITDAISVSALLFLHAKLFGKDFS